MAVECRAHLSLNRGGKHSVGGGSPPIASLLLCPSSKGSFCGTSLHQDSQNAEAKHTQGHPMGFVVKWGLEVEASLL